MVECLTRDRGVADAKLTQVLHYVLKQDTLSLLRTGITQEGPSRHNCNSVDWELKNQTKQKTMDCYTICILTILTAGCMKNLPYYFKSNIFLIAIVIC